MPNGRCSKHGGKSLAGIASPTFKTGRHSKYLPARLQERYAASVADPELLALREDIALLDARLGELLERVDTGESESLWLRLDEAWSAYERLPDASPKKSEARGLVAWLIRTGATDYAAWGEIQAIVEQRRKLSESEQKRLVAMQQLITTEQAMLFVAAVMDAARQTVTNRNDLAAFAARVHDLTNRAAA
jgi:hypothetical protein